MLTNIIAGTFIFILVGWPLLTLIADGIKHLWEVSHG